MKQIIVVGYKGDINQMPKQYREEIQSQLKHLGVEPQEILDYIIETDVYIDVDVRNFWKKKTDKKD